MSVNPIKHPVKNKYWYQGNCHWNHHCSQHKQENEITAGKTKPGKTISRQRRGKQSTENMKPGNLQTVRKKPTKRQEIPCVCIIDPSNRMGNPCRRYGKNFRPTF